VKNKNYNGYNSFQYLESGADYRLSSWLSVKRIFEDIVVFSLYDHMFVTPENLDEIFEYRSWAGTSPATRDSASRNLGMRLSDIVHQDMVAFTHVGVRASSNTSRMKPDEIIKACAEKGGVIGIEAAPHTTLTKNNPRHSIESFMEPFEYCVNLVLN